VSDLNEKIEERWRQRRKKGYNWPKLLIMLIILVALVYGMSMLQNIGRITGTANTAQVIDSTATDTTNVEITP
jgi:hypothetical protein